MDTLSILSELGLSTTCIRIVADNIKHQLPLLYNGNLVLKHDKMNGVSMIFTSNGTQKEINLSEAIE